MKDCEAFSQICFQGRFPRRSQEDCLPLRVLAVCDACYWGIGQRKVQGRVWVHWYAGVDWLVARERGPIVVMVSWGVVQPRLFLKYEGTDE